MPQEFNIKNDDPWNSLVIADGEELVVGTAVYQGEEIVLVGGVETAVARPCCGGTFNLDNGKIVEVVDGVITEISDSPAPQATMKAQAKARKKIYRK